MRNTPLFFVILKNRKDILHSPVFNVKGGTSSCCSFGMKTTRMPPPLRIGHRMMRTIQKTAEINNLFGLVGKHKMNFVLTSLPALSKFWRDVLRLPERHSEPTAMTQPNGIVPPLGATGKIPAPLVGKGKLI